MNGNKKSGIDVKRDVDAQSSTNFATTRKGVRWGVIVAAAGVVAACSSIPDAVNPVEWYNDTVDYFSDDDSVAEAERPSSGDATQTASADDKNASYPNINQTLDRPTTMSDEERRNMAQGLVADKSAARYAEGQINRQGDAVSPLASGPAVSGGQQVVAGQTVRTPAAQPQPTAPQAPQAPQMAAMPTTVIQGGAVTTTPAPSGSGSVADVYRANLAQRRPVDGTAKIAEPSIHLKAPGMPMRSANFPGAPVSGDFETLVISGDGIENANFVREYPQRSTSVVAIEPVPLRVVSQGLARPLGEFPAGAFRNSFKVATLQFGVGNAQLSAREMNILDKVVRLHRERGGKVRVVGHASSRTRNMGMQSHMQVNYSVSVARADQVASILVRAGVKADDLFVGAVADSQPQYAEIMPSGEAANRRTEVFIDY